MSDLEEDDRSDLAEEKRKLEILQEKFHNLPWPQRKVPFFLINPCKRSYKEIGEIMFDLYDNGKIKKVIIEHGNGEVLPHNASVYLHYSCFVEDKKEPFDSTLYRSLNPKHYQMSGGFLIPGFEIALKSMRDNEMAQFLIHPDYAYGQLGCAPRIPGNAYIMLLIHITGFINCGSITLEKRHKMLDKCTFSERLEVAKSHSSLAIDYYKHGRIKMAFHHFREGQYCVNETANQECEENERRAFLQKSFVNQMMCLTHPKYFNPKKILEINQLIEKPVLDLLQKNAKYHYCLGIANTYRQDFKTAADFFSKAQMISPFLPRLSDAVKTLHEKAGKFLKDEKFMWQEAFNKLGYSPLQNKVQKESDNLAQIRKDVQEVLTRCLKYDNFKMFNLGYGFTKDERQILAQEADKLGLKCEQYFEYKKICIKIINPNPKLPITM